MPRQSSYSRDRGALTREYSAVMRAAFAKHGRSAVERVALTDPRAFMLACAAFVPKETTIDLGGGFERALAIAAEGLMHRQVSQVVVDQAEDVEVIEHKPPARTEAVPALADLLMVDVDDDDESST